MKKLSQLLLSILVLLSFSVQAESGFYALFSPHQGQEAFNTIYSQIKQANKKVYLTIYSWSDTKVKDALLTALSNNVEVKLVLHKPLIKKSKVKDMVREIELAGADVKISHQNMHEKFMIVDDELLMNSSANMSNGARTKYSENFIFHSNKSKQGENLINEFNREFTFLFNSAKDFFTTGEVIADAIEIDSLNNTAIDDESVLYSSSLNFKASYYGSTTAAYKKGQYFKMTRIKNSKGQTWQVRDAIIDRIRKANKNIYASLNHLNIEAVARELYIAAKRGVDVRLSVDNQEFKTTTSAKEKTPLFVSLWKSIPGNAKKDAPVRVKFYSHAPSPRYWFLNHHKYLLIDYNEHDTSDTVLISGSYNISRTAEHKQYDNMVIYSGDDNKRLFHEFKKEFDNLWSLNRNSSDKPDQSLLDKISKPNEKNLLQVHSKEPISLTWTEVRKLRSKVSKIAKTLYYNAFKNRDCYYYSIDSQSYTACPSK